MSGWPTWVDRLISPRVTAAMSATPDDRPSSPSIQLMLLIMPTIQKIVKPGREAPSKRIDAAAERVVDEVDHDPERDRPAGQDELAGELPASAQVEQVVGGAEGGRDRAAEQQRRRHRTA